MELPNQTRDTLWTLIATPTIWALHFLFCYVVAAYDCAPNARIFQTIEGTRIAIAVATIVSLAAIAAIGWRAFREWRAGEGKSPHSADTAEDRERFMEFSSLLLAALSFVAVTFGAMPALVFVDCR
ncbi:hypothetical protein Sa4125_05620 [Aureimonas sp. SA4125]|uniref:hypothetical protein n=1 Tax=Aureimonas sp. SA4125 TaxID=2826993 RepID=UPI001CC72641|nr:hypothetical protein [Aureimonas sp. SA4125]BDA83020.1 hypothetical protein Sa4125_05620 [Aureimonas sp. SA4125]